MIPTKEVLLATHPEKYLQGLRIARGLVGARMEGLSKTSLDSEAYLRLDAERLMLESEIKALEKILAEAAAEKQAEREKGVPEPQVKSVPLGTIQEG